MRKWRTGLKSTAALAAAVTTIALSGTAAWAVVAPPNDSYAGAEVITTLPAHKTLDTTGATVGGNDAGLVGDCATQVTTASVWYKYTAAADGLLFADVSASNYGASVAVATGTPAAGFTAVACGQNEIAWAAAAGTTYVLLVFDNNASVVGGTMDLVLKTATNVRDNDFTGDGNADVVSRDANGRLYVYPGNGSGGWKTRIAYGTGWNAYTAILAPGDWDGDGHADLMARDTSGYLYKYAGDGASHFGARVRIGSGWNSMTAIVGVGDFDGDLHMDLMARDGLGKLYLYPGDGAGGFLARTPSGTGWNVMTALLGIGDFDGDFYNDLLARDGLGSMWLYRGNGAGGFISGRLGAGVGWKSFTALVAPQDFDGDGHVDALARTSSGYLYLYPGNGTGWWKSAKLIGSGWNSMTAIVS